LRNSDHYAMEVSYAKPFEQPGRLQIACPPYVVVGEITRVVSESKRLFAWGRIMPVCSPND
jgi:hypothetical protein